MSIHLRALAIVDRKAWLQLRRALWPKAPETRHLSQMDALLKSPSKAALGAFVDERRLVGFAEVGLRTDYVNGCDTNPVAFLEGIFVDHAERRRGVGRLLIEAVEKWATANGCEELASDADLGNTTSHRLHEGLGFTETERVVFYRKRLATPRRERG